MNKYLCFSDPVLKSVNQSQVALSINIDSIELFKISDNEKSIDFEIYTDGEKPVFYSEINLEKLSRYISIIDKNFYRLYLEDRLDILDYYGADLFRSLSNSINNLLLDILEFNSKTNNEETNFRVTAHMIYNNAFLLFKECCRNYEID